MRSNENFTVSNLYYINSTWLKTQMKPKFGLIKAVAVLIASMTLFACGGGSSSSTGSSTESSTESSSVKAVKNSDLLGVWSVCLTASPFSIRSVLNFQINNTISDLISTYANEVCNSDAGVMTLVYSSSSWQLGALLPDKQVTVLGKVYSLTNVTELTLTDATPGSEKLGEIEYNIIALDGCCTLFVGDTDTANDGSTEALRPVELTPYFWTKQ